MDFVNLERLEAARERAYRTPLDDLDVSAPTLFSSDTLWPYFERLREEAPVHYCAESHYGPLWSISRFHDIKDVDSDHQRFSAEKHITISDQDDEFELPMFIAMDRPKHPTQRKVVSPAVAPQNLAKLQDTIRERAGTILDDLPVGETFNWVDKVSIELTTAMLATMFDFDWETRRKLTYWSDMATISDEQLAEEGLETQDRENAMLECLQVFTQLWNERKGEKTDTLDFVSALANADATSDIDPAVDPITYIGTLMLLIVAMSDQ